MSNQVSFSVTGTIGDQTVETKHIANEAITESEIAPNAVIRRQDRRTGHQPHAHRRWSRD